VALTLALSRCTAHIYPSQFFGGERLSPPAKRKAAHTQITSRYQSTCPTDNDRGAVSYWECDQLLSVPATLNELTSLTAGRQTGPSSLVEKRLRTCGVRDDLPAGKADAGAGIPHVPMPTATRICPHCLLPDPGGALKNPYKEKTRNGSSSEPRGPGAPSHSLQTSATARATLYRLFAPRLFRRTRPPVAVSQPMRCADRFQLRPSRNPLKRIAVFDPSPWPNATALPRAGSKTCAYSRPIRAFHVSPVRHFDNLAHIVHRHG